MSGLILHHYPTSPFAEKARLLLGFKRLSWRSVQIPPMMPKPDLVALTGGYRKTPVLQVGADVYCDTALIARRLEQEKATRRCSPKGRIHCRRLRPVGRFGDLPARGEPGVPAGIHRRALRQAAAGIRQGLRRRP
jgi:glutathione S-transferase